jgi:hypothetical protein
LAQLLPSQLVCAQLCSDGWPSSIHLLLQMTLVVLHLVCSSCSLPPRLEVLQWPQVQGASVPWVLDVLQPSAAAAAAAMLANPAYDLLHCNLVQL